MVEEEEASDAEETVTVVKKKRRQRKKYVASALLPACGGGTLTQETGRARIGRISSSTSLREHSRSKSRLERRRTALLLMPST